MMNRLILFDGVCNLCNRSVQVVLKNDTKKKFRFASLQSEFASALLKKKSRLTGSFDSFILVEDGKIYERSTAALKVARQLKGLWPLLYGLIVVPPFIRDFVYSIIAKNRYKWFGRNNSCWLPSPEYSDRFID